MRIVLHVAGKDLDDVLTFNRLRADLKKLCPLHQVMVVHNADAQVLAELRRRGISDRSHLYETALVQHNKTVVARFSEELIPAIPMSGNHLGLLQTETAETAVGHFPFVKIVSVNAAVLEHQLVRGLVPVIAPLAADKSGGIQPVRSEHVAAKIASAIKADLLIFILEPDGYTKEKKPVATIHQEELSTDSEEGKIVNEATKSLKEGAKRAFLTKLGGMEKIIFEGATVPTEIMI